MVARVPLTDGPSIRFSFSREEHQMASSGCFSACHLTLFFSTCCWVAQASIIYSDGSIPKLDAWQSNSSCFMHELRHDGYKHAYLGKDAVSNRSLQGLTCRVLLAQKTCLELLLNFMDTECSEWPVQIRNAIRHFGACHMSVRESLV